MKRKTKLKGRLIKTVFIIIPILVMISIYFITETIYQNNLEQSYQTLKHQKESEVRRLVSEVDGYMDYMSKSNLEENEKYVVKFSVNQINKQKDVYCYLLDTNLDLKKEYNGILHEDEEELLKEINKEVLTENIKDELNNNFSLNIKGTEYDFYWQRIPTNYTEYYVLLATTKGSVTPNEAINTCKSFISILNIVLAISLYGNIYLSENNIIKKKEN